MIRVIREDFGDFTFEFYPDPELNARSGVIDNENGIRYTDLSEVLPIAVWDSYCDWENKQTQKIRRRVRDALNKAGFEEVLQVGDLLGIKIS